MASVSLDLDNAWSYLKIQGSREWEQRPSYLDIFVPHILSILQERQLEITFFIVGADAAEEGNRSHLQSLVEAGHEVGNHSFEHESWLQLYSRKQLEKEISSSQEAIETATGIRPSGFRGPGFSWSPELLEVLADSGFTYDASTFPTFLGPVARAYYLWTAKIPPPERKKRKQLFGTFRDGLRPITPYLWKLANAQTLLEIPVTTIPGLRLPFHLSYLVYLSRYSKFLMKLYLSTAVFLCRATGTEPSFLLHPLDVIGGDQIPSLSFFPGMDVASDKKVRIFGDVMGVLQRHFTLVPMGVHARALIDRGELSHRPTR